MKSFKNWHFFFGLRPGPAFQVQQPIDDSREACDLELHFLQHFKRKTIVSGPIKDLRAKLIENPLPSKFVVWSAHQASLIAGRSEKRSRPKVRAALNLAV